MDCIGLPLDTTCIVFFFSLQWHVKPVYAHQRVVSGVFFHHVKQHDTTRIHVRLNVSIYHLFFQMLPYSELRKSISQSNGGCEQQPDSLFGKKDLSKRAVGLNQYLTSRAQLHLHDVCMRCAHTS